MSEETMPWWTVVGIWEQTSERFADHFQAVTPRLAEDLARLDGRDKGGTLLVAGVFEGRLTSADWAYAKYTDPDRIE